MGSDTEHTDSLDPPMVMLPAAPVDMKPRADRSWKLSFETRELSGEEVALLADSLGLEGWLGWRRNKDILPKDLPAADADAGTKTPSQRLHAVLYILWKSRGSKGSFEAFYYTQLERLIEHIKEQLPPERS